MVNVCYVNVTIPHTSPVWDLSKFTDRWVHLYHDAMISAGDRAPPSGFRSRFNRVQQ